MSSYFSNEREAMRSFVPEGTKRVIEVGCAEGNFGAWLKREKGAEVWGLEHAEEAAAVAATKLDRVLAGDALQTVEQLPAAYFDVAVCNDVLEHLVEPEQMLRKLRRVLRPGGIVVVSIPNIRYWSAFRKIVFRADFPREDQGIFDRTHLRFFTRKTIIRLFSESGYALRRIEGLTPTTNREYYLINALLFGALSDCRYLQYACVAEPIGIEPATQ